MRYAIALAGLVIGMVLGVALLLLNPLELARPRLPQLAAPLRTLTWEGTERAAGIALRVDGLLGRQGGRRAPGAFGDPGIRHARADVVLLADGDGAPPALGVRLSALHPANSLMRAQLGIVADWNVIWPGEGSVFLAGSENFWAPLRDGLWNAVSGAGFRLRDPSVLQPMPGSGKPAVIGASGALAGAQGAYRETLAPVAARPADFAGQRQLDISLQ